MRTQIRTLQSENMTTQADQSSGTWHQHASTFWNTRRPITRNDVVRVVTTTVQCTKQTSQWVGSLIDLTMNGIYLVCQPLLCISLTTHLLNCDTMVTLEIFMNDKQYQTTHQAVTKNIYIHGLFCVINSRTGIQKFPLKSKKRSI
jgi:hypothetical protein